MFSFSNILITEFCQSICTRIWFKVTVLKDKFLGFRLTNYLLFINHAAMFTCPTSKCKQTRQNMHPSAVFHSHWLHLSWVPLDGSTFNILLQCQNETRVVCWDTKQCKHEDRGLNLWDLRFSQQWWWRFQFSRICCHVDLYISDVLEELSTSIFRVPTWHIVSKDWKFQISTHF